MTGTEAAVAYMVGFYLACGALFGLLEAAVGDWWTDNTWADRAVVFVFGTVMWLPVTLYLAPWPTESRRGN